MEDKMTADRKAKIVIIGGGPAGLAAASSAVKNGTAAEDILIIERDHVLGGILNQCIHNGFGLHTFDEELTGPEYAQRFINIVKEEHVPFLLDTIVVDVSTDNPSDCSKNRSRNEVTTGGNAGKTGTAKVISVMNKTDGFFTIAAEAVILAMGCRERPRGALNIPGYRPAGIYTAGTAQRFVNIEGRMPGHEVVILGSGDIGLIMARRMTLEGAKVKVVAELMPYSGGLKRNIVQCLDDFGIPLKLSHTVIDIKGKERVEAVTIAEVGPDRKPVPGTEETYTCDTLLLSCGLIPENELSSQMGVEMNRVTSGPVVNESLETSVPGVFACGNVLHVHDLVDYVSEEATAAGKCAAKYVNAQTEKDADTDVSADSGRNTDKGENGHVGGTSHAMPYSPVDIIAKDGVRYTVPSIIHIDRMEDLQKIRFRVGEVYRDAAVVIDFDDRVFRSQKKRILAPGEMEQVILKKSDLEAVPDLKTITIRIEEMKEARDE